MENLLAIDINDECVSWVVAEHGQKSSVVTGYGVVSIRDMSLAEALASIGKETEDCWEECRVSLSGGEFSFRNLVLPFGDARKIEKILPFELEELTFYKIGEFQQDFLTAAVRENGTEIVAAMIEKDHVAEMLSRLGEADLDPEILGVAGVETASLLLSREEAGSTFVLLDAGLKQTTLVLVNEGAVALVRTFSVDAENIAGFSLSLPDAGVVVRSPGHIPEIGRKLIQSVQQTLISVGSSSLLQQGMVCYVNGCVGLYPAVFEMLEKGLALELRSCNIAGQPLLKIEPGAAVPWNPAYMNRALALALWKRKDGPIFNFRKGVFKKQPSIKHLRETAKVVSLALLVVAVAVFGFCWWEYSDLAKKRDELRDEVLAVFNKTLPDVTRVVNPVQQLQVRINETRDMYLSGSNTRKNNTKLALLTELSSRIPESLAIRITRLVADQDDVRITAETNSFKTVDNVKRELEKSDLFRSVVINSANLAPKGGEIRFELKLEFR